MNTEAKKSLLEELKKYQSHLTQEVQRTHPADTTCRHQFFQDIHKVEQAVHVLEKDLGLELSYAEISLGGTND